jgi:hypothetical protein
MRNSVTVSVTGLFFQVQVCGSGSIRRRAHSRTLLSVSLGRTPSFGEARRIAVNIAKLLPPTCRQNSPP